MCDGPDWTVTGMGYHRHARPFSEPLLKSPSFGSRELGLFHEPAEHSGGFVSSSGEEPVGVQHAWRNWEVDCGSHVPLDLTRGTRHYAHWKFADQLASIAQLDDVARGVMMQKLWNAVDGRVRLLFQLYELRTLLRHLGWTGMQKRHRDNYRLVAPKPLPDDLNQPLQAIHGDHGAAH